MLSTDRHRRLAVDHTQRRVFYPSTNETSGMSITSNEMIFDLDICHGGSSTCYQRRADPSTSADHHHHHHPRVSERRKSRRTSGPLILVTGGFHGLWGLGWLTGGARALLCGVAVQW